MPPKKRNKRYELKPVERMTGTMLPSIGIMIENIIPFDFLLFLLTIVLHRSQIIPIL